MVTLIQKCISSLYYPIKYLALLGIEIKFSELRVKKREKENKHSNRTYLLHTFPSKRNY